MGRLECVDDGSLCFADFFLGRVGGFWSGG